MKDNEIIKTLQDMANEYEGNFSNTVIDFINRLQAEIERLQKENEGYEHLKVILNTAIDVLAAHIKSEARKEFAERLKNVTVPVVLGGKYHYDVITKEGIDNLLKELDGKDGAE